MVRGEVRTMMGIWRWVFGWEDYGLRGLRWEGDG